MPPIRIGTDYSGIETPLMALDKLGIPYKHMFSSEIDPNARRVIISNFNPGILFEDATTRNHKKLPAIDLYVAGFPCQLFSTSRPTQYRKRPKKEDLKHFFVCIDTITATNPTIFILENVPGLKSAGDGYYFDIILKYLNDLENYYVSILQLNANNYGSLQNRKRLFFVGVYVVSASGPLTSAPLQKRQPRSFQSILERNADRRQISAQKRQFFDKCTKNLPFSVFIPIKKQFGRCGVTKQVPCLQRSSLGVYWSGRGGLMTTVREEARLQGIPDDFDFPSEISDTNCRQLIGNAMSVDCLRALFNRVFRHVGWR